MQIWHCSIVPWQKWNPIQMNYPIMYIILDWIYVERERQTERQWEMKVGNVFKSNFLSFLLPKAMTRDCAWNKKSSPFANDYFVLRADSVNLNMIDILSSKELIICNEIFLHTKFLKKSCVGSVNTGFILAEL